MRHWLVLLVLAASLGCRREVGSVPQTGAAATPATRSAPTPTDSPTGDLGYRETLDFAVASVEDYWATWLAQLWRAEFKPVTDVIAYNYSDPDSVPYCGFERAPPNNAMYCPDYDYIAWDDEILMPSVYRDFGDLAAALIIAHEYAHAIQFRVGATGPSIVLELQADCFAGAWTASLTDADLVVTRDDLDQALAGYLQFRDDIWISAAAPGAHGSGFDRFRAFLDGLRAGPEPCADYTRTWPVFADLSAAADADSQLAGQTLAELVPLLLADFNSYWRPTSPSFEPPSYWYLATSAAPAGCTTDTVGHQAVTAYLCTSANSILINRDSITGLWGQSGDAGATYPIAHAYHQALAQQRAPELTKTQVILTADCIAGTWARDNFDDLARGLEDPTYQPTYRLHLSAGDLDEMLTGLLLIPPVAPDGTVVTAINPFDRAEALSTGFFNGDNTCWSTWGQAT